MKFTNKKIRPDFPGDPVDPDKTTPPEIPESGRPRPHIDIDDRVPPAPISQDRPGGELPLDEQRPHPAQRHFVDNVDVYP